MDRWDVYEHNKKYLDGKKHFYYVTLEDITDMVPRQVLDVNHYKVPSDEEFGMSACFNKNKTMIACLHVVNRFPTLNEMASMPTNEAIDSLMDNPNVSDAVKFLSGIFRNNESAKQEGKH